MEARANKHKLGARVGKYKLGARVGKYRLSARARGQAEGRGPGNTNTHFTHCFGVSIIDSDQVNTGCLKSAIRPSQYLWRYLRGPCNIF